MSAVNKTRILLLLAVIALFLLTGKAYQNQSLSFHFVDEEDNIVLGNYLLKGEKLYSDLFSHHQPLAYVFSAGVQKTTEPNTLYLLIKRHREAIIAWSFFWAVLLVWRFRLLMLLTLLIYEPLKIFLLGNLFLSESLVVYPLAYMLGWVFLAKKLYLKEMILLGFCLSLSFLLLSPLWPLLGVLALYIFRKGRLGRAGWLGLLGGSAIPLILVINFISIPDYLFNAFYINFKYYIPMTSRDPLIFTTLKAFASPLLTFINFQNNNATFQVARILSVVLVFSCIFLVKKGNWKLPLLSIVLLGFANIRFVPPGEQGYSGFHIIPWFIALIITTLVSVKLVWKSGVGKLGRLGLLGVLGLLAVIVIRESGQTLFQKKDIARDFYVNYSRQAEFGAAVKIMKGSGDTLFVVPDEWLIYWQADIDHSSKMVNYYAWMSEVPEIKKPLHEIFAKNPPTYFYCDRCQFGYFGLEEFFPNFQRFKKDGKETNLLVLKEKVQDLSPEQKDKLKYYGFEVGR